VNSVTEGSKPCPLTNSHQNLHELPTIKPCQMDDEAPEHNATSRNACFGRGSIPVDAEEPSVRIVFCPIRREEKCMKTASVKTCDPPPVSGCFWGAHAMLHIVSVVVRASNIRLVRSRSFDPSRSRTLAPSGFLRKWISAPSGAPVRPAGHLLQPSERRPPPPGCHSRLRCAFMPDFSARRRKPHPGRVCSPEGG